MSVLETPRILFRGQIAWDPIVTNNYPRFYNENDCETVLPAESIQAAVADFRQEAIDAVAKGNWNPHGTHRSSFFDTEISGVDLGAGVTTADPAVGAPVGFLGMLVDCEPYGSVSSQLFFDTMDFGIAGGCRVSCARNERIIARYINFSRNTANTKIAGVASVVWQTSFRKETLQLDPHQSPALLALRSALDSHDVLGLTVRFNSYRTIYYDDPSLRNGSTSSAVAARALIAKLNQGGFQPNPARSVVVGVLGLWRRGEPAQEPGDRALLAVPPGEVVATAHARLTPRDITLDLANSITEVDDLLNKQDLGPLSLVALDGAGTATTLGILQYHDYDSVAYERGSGIVTIPLDPALADLAASSDLQLRAGDGTPYLIESRLRAIPLAHNIYVTCGDSATLPVQVLAYGAPAGAGIDVTLYDGNGVVVGSAATDADSMVVFTVPSAPTGSVDPYTLVATDAHSPSPEPQQLDPQLTTYAYIRSIPADTAIGALEPSWDNVYAKVLANWNAMAPCMDNWLKLDDPAQVRAFAPVLRTLTDPANFESYRFMPVTRDMTPGERTLLYNFLDSPADVVALGAERLVEPAKRKTRDIGQLSRAMREG